MIEVLSSNRDLEDILQEEELMLRIELGKLPSYNIGMERGMEQGLETGTLQSSRGILIRLLGKRFGDIDPRLVARIEQAELADILKWSDRVLEADRAGDVFQ